MKKNQPIKKVTTEIQPKNVAKVVAQKPSQQVKKNNNGKQQTKIISKEPIKKQVKVQQKETLNQPLQKVQVFKKEQIKKQEKLQITEIPIMSFLKILDEPDKKCVFLVDKTGNCANFIKYKGRLINLSLDVIEVKLGKQSKETLVEAMRKILLWGIKSGENILINIGDIDTDLNDFFKGVSFWNPSKLFTASENYDEKWYRENLMKADDKDLFGNAGSFYPSGECRLILSYGRDVTFEEIAKKLNLRRDEFISVKIKE